MYNINPQSIKTFIEDKSIKLPRFQRKKTWKDEQNFLLAVSVFKNYPIGVVILNEDKDANNRQVKYLLDGRQRRHALTTMYQNPEEIYYWAKKYCKIKVSATSNEVVSIVYDSITDYIELDSEITRTSEEIQTDISAIEYTSKDEVTDISDDNVNSFESGIRVLLRLMKLAHEGYNGRTHNTGLTEKFNFLGFFKKLPYIDSTTKTVNTISFTRFLNNYSKWCDETDVDYKEGDSFIAYMEEQYEYIDDAKKNSFKTQIDLYWNEILERIQLFMDVAQVITDAKIGVIEINNITPADSQKIFDLINSKGTKLTPAEVLSARPAWNKEITNPCDELVKCTEELYKFIGIESIGVVKWDVCATFVQRLKDHSMFLYQYENDLATFEKNVGLGFKLLSGLLLEDGGVKQEDIAKLSVAPNVNWVSDVDNLVSELKQMFKIITEFSYFSFYKSWRKSFMQLLGDGPAINFILVMYKYWSKLGKPIGASNTVKHFQKNAFVLFDRMVYEYVNDQWKGASDSKISRNLNAISTNDRIDFEPVGKEKWINLINDDIDKFTVADNQVTQHTKLTPVLYHFYALKGMSGPDTNYSIDIDHIYPQATMKNSHVENKELLVHILSNLALLPSDDNKKKSDKTLKQIDNDWLKQQVVKYEEIKLEDFDKYSNVNNFNELKEERRKLYIQAFTIKRDNILNN